MSNRRRRTPHVNGGGNATKIGQNGKPIAGSPELSKKQQRVVDRNLSKIRAQIGKSMRWFASGC